MKVSLITMHYVHNYGSVLQAFATQYLLEKAGHQVETVNYTRENCKRESMEAETRARLKAQGGGQHTAVARAALP